MPCTVVDSLFRRAIPILLICGCTALDDRNVTLHNGEQCSERRQCESLHCELAAEGAGEEQLHICCSISCAAGSACAPSGTSCIVCAAGQCEEVCDERGCAEEHVQVAPNTGPKGSSTSATRSVAPSTGNGVEAGNTSLASSVPTGESTTPHTDAAAVDAGAVVNAESSAETTSDQESRTKDVAPTTSAPTSTTGDAPTDGTLAPRDIPECGEPLLINGDFENEMQAWTEETSFVGLSQRVHPLVVAVDDESVRQFEPVAQSGSYFAYVGGVPDDEDRGHHSAIVQKVIIPTNATALWLRGYVWVTTEDTPDDEYDFGFIQLERTPEDEHYLQFDFWTNQDANDGWLAFDLLLDDLSDLPGKEVRFLVGSITDQQGTTRFWFDALRLEGICE